MFALTNLPETVKGALFARYSRSAKSVRRLFLDEFRGDVGRRRHRRTRARSAPRAPTSSTRACSASMATIRWRSSAARTSPAKASRTSLTKVLEWGRLMAYLEQSTRYVPHTDRPNGRWKYHVPAELDRSPLRDALRPHARSPRSRPTRAGSRRWRRTSAPRYPKSPDDSDGVYKSVIRAKALDTLRGLLPAATTSNVGLFGTGQAFEALLLRMFAHPLAEVRDTRAADADRAAQGDPGVSRTRRSAGSRRPVDRVFRRRHAASSTPWRVRSSTTSRPSRATKSRSPTSIPTARLKVVAAGALRRVRAARRSTASRSPAGMTADDRRGAPPRLRRQPRQPPPQTRPRASNARSYRFDVLADYGAFRDLQRHRLLTLEWQPLSTRHGYVEPAAIEEAGALARLARGDGAVGGSLRAAAAHAVCRRCAPYAVVMAYRVRFYMDMNAREAMHVIELRTAPQGHPSYRRDLPADAPRDRGRRRPPRHRRRDAVRRSLGGRSSNGCSRNDGWNNVDRAIE